MEPTNIFSNFILSTCKIIAYLVITVIVYTTLHNLYAEKETATIEALKQQLEVQEVHHLEELEGDVVELL